MMNLKSQLLTKRKIKTATMLNLKKILTRLKPVIISRSKIDGSWAQRLKPQTAFLILGSVFGLGFLLVTPPSQIPDEPNHLFRAYEISEGKLTTPMSGGQPTATVPANLAEVSQDIIDKLPGNTDNKFKTETLSRYSGYRLDSGSVQKEAISNTAVYSPVNYLPQAITFKIANLVSNPSVLVLTYIVRFITLLTWLALVYLAIRLTPVGQWAFVTLSLIPMSLSQAASASADGVNMGLAFLTLALFLKYRLTGAKLDNLKSLSLILLATLTALLKMPYSLLAYLLIFIKKSAFRKKLKYRAYISATALAITIPLVVWLAFSQSLYVPIVHDDNIVPNPDKQLSLIKQNPIEYVETLVRTHFTGDGNRELGAFFGRFGWYDTPLPTVLVLLHLSLIFIAISPRKPAIKLARDLRFKLVAGFLGLAIIIDSLIYLSWTSVGNEVVNGVQGRYYLAIAPLAAIGLYGLLKLNMSEITRKLILCGGLLVSLSLSLLVVIARFYFY